MNYQELRAALTMNSGTFTISRDTADSSLAAFLDAYYLGQPLVLESAAPGSGDDVNQTIVVTGTSTFFGVANLAVTARFYLDGAGQVQALLKYQLRDSAPAATAWTISQTFPSLPSEWNYDTGYDVNDSGVDLSGEQTSYVASLDLLNTYCVVSSCAGQDPDSAVPVVAGMNLLSQFRPGGMAGVLEAALTDTQPLTLYGPIRYPQNTQPLTPLSDSQMLWAQPDAPGINLRCPLPLSFKVGNLTLDQAALLIYTPLTTDWLNANPGFGPVHGYTCTLSVPSANIQVVLTAGLQWNLPRVVLSADCNGVTLGNLAQLVDLAGTDALSSLLPDALRSAVNSLAQLELMSIVTTLTQDGTTVTVDAISVQVGLPSLTWSVFDNLFQIESITCRFDISRPFGSSPTGSSRIVATLEGTLSIAGVGLEVGARSDTSFSLYAKLASGQTIPLGSLMQQYASGLPVPASLTIKNLSVCVTPGTSYSMAMLMSASPPWSIDLGPTPLSVSSVGMALSHGASGTSGNFSGNIALGSSVSFDINYAVPGQLSLKGQLPDVSLSWLVSTLTGGAIELPGFDLGLGQPTVQLNSDGTNWSFQLGAALAMGDTASGMVAFEVMKVGTTWGYALGLALDLGALSTLGGMSALAQLEAIFPLSAIVLVACSAVPANWSFPALSQFNNPALGGRNIAIPGSPSIQAGFNAYATFSLSGSMQLRMLKQIFDPGDGLNLALHIGTNPSQDASVSAALSGHINSATTMTGALVASLSQGGVQLAMDTSVATQIQGQPYIFTGILAVTPTSCDLSATMQGSVSFLGVTLSNLSFEIGIDPILIPSIGVAATIAVQNFDSSIAIFFDSGNPAQSLFTGAVANLSLREVVDTLAGSLNLVPASLLQALPRVSLKGTGAFTIPAASAADAVAALNRRDAAAVSSAFMAAGSVVISTSNTGLLIVRGKNNTWFVTDLVNVKHYQVSTNADGSLNVSLEAQIYCAPQPTQIGALSFPQGFNLNCTLSLFGLSLTAIIRISSGQGISADAYMTPITLGSANFFSLTGAAGQSGPRFSMSTYAQPSQSDPLLQPPHLLISGQLTLLGCTQSLYISIGDTGLTFSASFDAPDVTWTVTGSWLNLTNLSAAGAIAINLQNVPPLNFGALGTVKLNSLGGSLSLSYSGGTPTGWLSGTATLQGQTFSTGTVTLSTIADTLAGLPQVTANALKAPIQSYLNVASQWLGWVKNGVMQGVSSATQIGQVLASTFNQSAQQIAQLTQSIMGYDASTIGLALKGASIADAAAASALKSVGYLATDVAAALKSAYGETDAAAAAALKSAGYWAMDIGPALKTVWNDSDAAGALILKNTGWAVTNVGNALQGTWGDTDAAGALILNNIGFAATDVGTALKATWKDTDAAAASAMRSAAVFADSAVGTMLKSVYGDTDATAAKAMKTAGYAATNVANALKSAYVETDSAAATTLKNAGYVASDVGTALKSVYADTDAAAAKALKTAGYSASDVGTALKSVYGDTDSACASAMKAAGFTANDISSALSSAYGDAGTVTANILNNLGYSGSVINTAIQGAYGATHVDTVLGHLDSTAHADIPHMDGAHVDGAHIDGHDDTHADTRAFHIHTDGAHVDRHDDTHDDTHADTKHGDSSTHSDSGTHIDA